jgi:hypothetical protein
MSVYFMIQQLEVFFETFSMHWTISMTIVYPIKAVEIRTITATYMIYDQFYVFLLKLHNSEKRYEKDFFFFYGNNVTIAARSLFGHVG